jgi:hypothetical protein
MASRPTTSLDTKTANWQINIIVHHNQTIWGNAKLLY